MPTTRHRRDRSTAGSQLASAVAGGVVGVAVGLVLAQTLGGASGIVARFSRVVDGIDGFVPGVDGAVDEPDGELVEELDDDVDDGLGERVLEAFRNDPTLAERPIDIDAGWGGTIELAGQVDDAREIEYASTVAGGVPGVRRVITRLGVKDNGRLPSPG
jgi:BON domain